MNIFEIRKLAKPRNISPTKVLKCEKCGSTESLHLYNYHDPYSMGWGYNPQLFCEDCRTDVQETPFLMHRGKYDPVLHNRYLGIGGIDYKKIQWSSHFICYDCRKIQTDGEKRGYADLLDKSGIENRLQMMQFCMDCWETNHLIDSPLIDSLVYTYDNIDL